MKTVSHLVSSWIIVNVQVFENIKSVTSMIAKFRNKIRIGLRTSISAFQIKQYSTPNSEYGQSSNCTKCHFAML